MDEAEKKRIARAIRDYIDRARISRETFARRASIGKSTVDKLLIGLFSERTLTIVEERTKVVFRSRSIVEERAAAALGGYMRSEMGPYEGTYLFLRPDFVNPTELYAFAMSISWDDASQGLVLRHQDETDPQFGALCIPRASSHVYVRCEQGGGVQQLIVSRLDADGKMKGLLLTLGNVLGNLYIPMACPIVLMKSEANSEVLGQINQNHPQYSTYLGELQEVTNDSYARLLLPASP